MHLSTPSLKNKSKLNYVTKGSWSKSSDREKTMRSRSSSIASDEDEINSTARQTRGFHPPNCAAPTMGSSSLTFLGNDRLVTAAGSSFYSEQVSTKNLHGKKPTQARREELSSAKRFVPNHLEYVLLNLAALAEQNNCAGYNL